MPQPKPTLKRTIGLTALVFYGVGTMVGGGFYALMGKVVGEAGYLAPVALVGSGMLALVNGLAFAELTSRFPVSAGEARYVEEGFGRAWLATVTGVLVILTGVVSAATLATATAGFIRELVPLAHTIGVIAVVLALGAVAAWGIAESVAMVTVITIIEVGALLFVVAINAGEVPLSPSEWSGIDLEIRSAALVGVFSGAFLAFYAFIGFEDMVNIAEEVKRPRRTLPIAILLSVAITTLLYIAVSVVAVSSVDLSRLSESRAPIAELMRRTGAFGRSGIVLVSVLTGINGALVQIVMAARVAYGLSDQGRAPAWVGRVHPRTRTPLYATGVMTGVILLLALAFPLTQLARATSAIILMVFALVNLALWRVKATDPDPEGEGPRYPRWVPLLGFVSCIGVLLVQGWLVIFGGYAVRGPV